ncbi:hypothetical protein M8494_18930 [Serratia ureilytica]
MFGGEAGSTASVFTPITRPVRRCSVRASAAAHRWQARDVRMVDVEQVQQQQVGAWLAASSALVTLLSSGWCDRDGFADQDAPFAGADGEQVGFADIGQIAGAAVQIAFHEASSDDVSGNGRPRSAQLNEGDRVTSA